MPIIALEALCSTQVDALTPDTAMWIDGMQGGLNIGHWTMIKSTHTGRAFMDFDIAGLNASQINSAILHIWTYVEYSMTLYFIKCADKWDAQTLTWNTQPNPDMDHIVTRDFVPETDCFQWVTVDVTDIMQAILAEGENGRGIAVVSTDESAFTHIMTIGKMCKGLPFPIVFSINFPWIYTGLASHITLPGQARPRLVIDYDTAE